MSVCMSVTLTESNEIPFGRDTNVVPSNTVLDRGPGPHSWGNLGVKTPVKICIEYCGKTITDSRMVTTDSL